MKKKLIPELAVLVVLVIMYIPVGDSGNNSDVHHWCSRERKKCRENKSLEWHFFPESLLYAYSIRLGDSLMHYVFASLSYKQQRQIQ